MVLKKKMTKPIAIGLIGGICSGKSFVAQVLERLGAKRIDADEIGHSVLDRPLIARKAGQLFGEQVLDRNGVVSREMLAEMVFGESPDSVAARKKLETLLHPLIHATAVQQLRSFKEAKELPRAIVIDAPLLIEAGWVPMCDAIILVDTSDATRVNRALARGWREEQLRRREAAQLSIAEKRRHATHVLSGEASVESLTEQLEKILNDLNAEAAG